MLNPLKNFSDLHKRIITGLVLFTIILHGAGLYQFISLAIQNGYFPGPTKWTIAIAINGLLILTEIASLFIIRNSSYLIQIKKAYKRIVSLLSHSGWLNLLLSGVFIAGFTYIAINPTGQYIPFPFTRLFLFLVAHHFNYTAFECLGSQRTTLSFITIFSMVGHLLVALYLSFPHFFILS